MPHYRGMYRHAGRHCTHHSPPAFLVHAAQGSNPKLCILTPEATLWSQHNFQLLELSRARQGRSGDSAFSLWFLGQPLVCSFSTCCSSPPFWCFLRPLRTCFLPGWQGTPPRAKQHPKCFKPECRQDSVTQCHLSLPCRTCTACHGPASACPLAHTCRATRGISHLTLKPRDLCHLWSVFKHCSNHCTNCTQTVLSARLLIAVNITN